MFKIAERTANKATIIAPFVLTKFEYFDPTGTRVGAGRLLCAVLMMQFMPFVDGEATGLLGDSSGPFIALSDYRDL
jgi:hypothetical protein